MTSNNDTTLHRLLDELLAPFPVTADLQDFKEELRGNLLARVDELEADGMDAPSAARTAVRELGDITDAVGALGASGSAPSMVEMWGRHRVRPRPAFVMRAIVLSLLVAAGVTAVALAAFGVVAFAPGMWASVALGIVVGVLVADSLSQETTVHHPMPRRRAVRYGIGAGLLGVGLAFGAVFVANLGMLWLVVTAALVAIAGALVLVWLGVTQTNRTKSWVLTSVGTTPEDAFTRDPASAARFGLYTVVIWGVAATAFVVLSFTVGFVWSWLALAAGAVVFFLTLARMLFPVERH